VENVDECRNQQRRKPRDLDSIVTGDAASTQSVAEMRTDIGFVWPHRAIERRLPVEAQAFFERAANSSLR